MLQFVSLHPYLATATALALGLVAVYEMRARAESLISVSPQELIRLMNQGALILDLRSAEQFQAGHLSGARQMGGDSLLTAGDALKRYKEKAVVVYDDAGSASAAAVRRLNAQGFTRAAALRGGLAAWRADNLPLARE